MKPPKTAALWTQLERLGWRHDALPVATIMASYEAMEEELAELKAGFDAEGRTAAEACCEEFKREQANEIRRLALRSIRLAEDLDQTRQDANQSAEIIHLKAKLASERALADGLAEALAESVKRLEVCGGSRQWLAAWKAARDGETENPCNPIPSADEIDAHLDDLAAKSAREWKSLRDDPEVFYPRGDELR